MHKITKPWWLVYVLCFKDYIKHNSLVFSLFWCLGKPLKSKGFLLRFLEAQEEA